MANIPESLNAEKLLRIVLDTVPIRVFWKDTQSRFLGGNQLFLQDLGLDNINDLIGKSDYDFALNTSDAEHFIADDAEVMNTAKPKLCIEEAQIVPGQSPKWLRTNKVPMLSAKAEVIGILGTYEDITEQIEYRQLIEKQALIDSLTGMANRRKLQDALENFSGEYAGLMFIDLDHFKAVNDSLGHSVGDTLLQQVATRLLGLNLNAKKMLNQLPEQELDPVLITRLGGDEFGIFIPCPDIDDAQANLESLAAQIVKSLVEPFSIEHHIVNLGASVGITIVDKKQSSTATGFREADMAMYAAKAKGRNTYQFYDVSMKEAAEHRHKLKSCLFNAIKKNELSLVYQPQLDDQNNLIGAEALLRWHNKNLGSVPPDEFISLAEQSGLIHDIGDWVLNTALDTLATWLPLLKNNDNFKMAVNFSSKQFQDESLAKTVEKSLAARNIDHKYLQIEITESVLIEHKDRAVKSMLRLQKLGISIAIDDFGTGYSSLSYLAILPIDKLKIDRAFVTDLHIKSTNRKLVDTMVNMSKNLHMEVIAEGVETIEEKEALIALGCHQFQGYYFSKPIDAGKLQSIYLKTPVL
ncbi:MAG: diguanylate cyclase (GGDEF)-like protein [Alphaproteobacteria bacterium]